MELDPTRMCALLVGLPDVFIVAVDAGALSWPAEIDWVPAPAELPPPAGQGRGSGGPAPPRAAASRYRRRDHPALGCLSGPQRSSTAFHPPPPRKARRRAAMVF